MCSITYLTSNVFLLAFALMNVLFSFLTCLIYRNTSKFLWDLAEKPQPLPYLVSKKCRIRNGV